MSRQFGICGQIVVDASGLVLAPDATYPSDRQGAGSTLKVITGIDGSSGFTTALSLSGPHVICRLIFSSLTVETIGVRLTIDGTEIWDGSTFTAAETEHMYGEPSNAQTGVESMTCKTSFLLELLTTTDNDATLTFLSRPIQ